MAESAELRSAREHLSRAEAKYRSEDGLFHLEEGLALLEEVIAGTDAEATRVARNLLSTYAAKICAWVDRLVEADRGLPEPELEHFFRLILAFDQRGLKLTADTRAIKVSLVRRLIDRYLEGHPPAAKQAALDQLAKISGMEDVLPPARASRARKRDQGRQ